MLGFVVDNNLVEFGTPFQHTTEDILCTPYGRNVAAFMRILLFK